MSRPIPETSITLLNAIKSDPGSTRWAEFLRVYEAPMRAFLARNFPSLEADDVLQDTMVALMKCLPNYHYTPDEKGYFHNYLTGIVKHKALEVLRKNKKAQRTIDGLRNEPESVGPQPDDAKLEEWKNQVLETALQQLLADTTIDSQKREIFRAVALQHEKPVDVAHRYGTTRENVDVIKSRMIDRLQEIAVALMKAAD